MTAILQAANRDKTNYQCLQSTSSKYYLKSVSTCCLPFLCFHRLNLREVKGNSQSDSKMKGKMLRKVFLYCSGKCTFFPLAQEQKRESGSFPSPKLTITLSSHLGQNVGLGEGIHWLKCTKLSFIALVCKPSHKKVTHSKRSSWSRKVTHTGGKDGQNRGNIL